MKIALLLFPVFFSHISFGQSLTIPDVDSIIKLQNNKRAVSSNANRFIERKIPFHSIFGSTGEENGSMHNIGFTFKKDSTKEMLWVKIDEGKYKDGIFYCEMGYTAPQPVINKMEKELRQNGYRYKKRKKYYLRKKNRREYNTIRIRPNCIYVSELDNQPEIIFSVYKKLE